MGKPETTNVCPSPPNPSPGSLSIAYIIEKFPSTTEYFILKEILALEKRDVKIIILAITKPGHTVAISGLADLKAPVFYASVAPFFFHFPYLVRYYKKLWMAISNQHCFSIKTILKQLKYWLLAIGFEKQLKNNTITHVHAHFAFVATDVGHILSELLGVTFSFTAHAQDIYLNQPSIIKKIKEASYVVTCTKHNEHYIKQLTGHMFDDKIYHVYHGIEVNGYAAREKNIHADKAIIRVLTVARLVEKKGIIYLLKALKILTDNRVNVICTIIGDGYLRKELECFACKTGISGYVNFQGMKGRSDVLDAMSGTDMFVLPSIVAEDRDMDGLPNVLLEAMVMGVPVISTPVSGIPELIENGSTGILVAEKDETAIAMAIINLNNDKTLCHSITANAKKKIQHSFNVDASTEKLIHLFLKYAKN